MDWIELALAMGVFMVSHRLPAALGIRGWLVGRLGIAGYTVVFSAFSTGLLFWLILAAGRAPFVALWDQAGWHRWAVNIAMPIAIALGVYGVGAANPFAFEGRATAFDPQRPGIAGLTRQPLLWALALWAGAHLLANGDLAHVALFAPFLLLALAGIRIVESRRARAMGPSAFAALAGRTSALPLAALVTGRWRPQSWPSARRGLLALALWALLWQMHAPLIGVWPAP